MINANVHTFGEYGYLNQALRILLQCTNIAISYCYVEFIYYNNMVQFTKLECDN